MALRARAVRKPETVRSRPAGASQLSNQLQSPCLTLTEMYRQRGHCAHSFWQRSVAESQSLPCLALALGLAKGHCPWLAWLHVQHTTLAESAHILPPPVLKQTPNSTPHWQRVQMFFLRLSLKQTPHGLLSPC